MSNKIFEKLKNEYQKVELSNSEIHNLLNTDYLKQYKKSSFTKKYYKDKTIDLNEIEKLIPQTVKELKTDILWNGKFYCITFRKYGQRFD
jgi:hypothetical protein